MESLLDFTQLNNQRAMEKSIARYLLDCYFFKIVYDFNMLTFESLIANFPPHCSIRLYEPNTQKPTPYCFALNVSNIGSNSKIEIAPECFLRRAKSAEIIMINEWLIEKFGKYILSDNAYKSEVNTDLSNEKWPYHVIDFDGTEDQMRLIEKTLTIYQKHISIGFINLKIKFKEIILSGMIDYPERLSNILGFGLTGSRIKSKGETISKSDGLFLKKLAIKIKKHNDQIVDLNRIIMQMSEITELSSASTMKFLGYFAILESILAHAPNPDDKYESITRQIKQKLALLNARSVKQFDYSKLGSNDHNMIWSRMYEMRSNIAHGSIPDFKKNLKILKGQYAAFDLLESVLKQVIIHILDEPQLIRDLRNC